MVCVSFMSLFPFNHQGWVKWEQSGCFRCIVGIDIIAEVLTINRNHNILPYICSYVMNAFVSAGAQDTASRCGNEDKSDMRLARTAASFRDDWTASVMLIFIFHIIL